MKKLILIALFVALLIFLFSGVKIGLADRVPVSSQGVITGSCITSSSTIFAFQNPVAATTTITYFQLEGVQGATTTDILVATSSTPAPAGTVAIATSTLNQKIMGLAGIVASRRFFSVAGQVIGPGGGYNTASGGPYVTQTYTVLGPSEWIIGFSTSTVAGQTGSGSQSVPASCTYKAAYIQ